MPELEYEVGLAQRGIVGNRPQPFTSTDDARSWDPIGKRPSPSSKPFVWQLSVRMGIFL